MSEVSARAKAGIEVTGWEPETFDEAETGPKLVRIGVRETFSGDIAGTGRAAMLQALSADGSASFVGLERVTGSVGGRSGSFVLQDTGTLAADGTVTGEWFVVAGSGTGQLAGLSGAGGFTARLGEHAEAWLDYVLA
jgi:Protein of unknown function (DUF3224)